ncbi:MAG TPA: hypothetical protein VGH16_20625, partial [Candidatus Binatia bacterium]
MTKYDEFYIHRFLSYGRQMMREYTIKTIILLNILIAAIFFLIASTSAQDRAFLSTSIASSEATYLIQYEAGVSAKIQSLSIAFPADGVNEQVYVRNVLIENKPAKISHLSKDEERGRLFVYFGKDIQLRPGTQIELEVLGLRNPGAGHYDLLVSMYDQREIEVATIPVALVITPVNIIEVAGGAATLAKKPKPDITSVIAGAGLSGGGASGDVTLAVNNSSTQARVTGSCAEGSSIREIKIDGTVICEADDNSGGTVTSVTAAAPLASSGGTTPNITLPHVKILPNTIAVGENALANNHLNTDPSVAVGPGALQNNTTGSGNVAIGDRALTSN